MVLLAVTSRRKRQREQLDSSSIDAGDAQGPSIIPWKSTSLPGATSIALRSKLPTFSVQERFSVSVPLSDTRMNEITLQDRRYHLRLTGINVSLKPADKLGQRLPAPSGGEKGKATQFAILVLSTLPESSCPIVLGRLSGQVKSDGALQLDSASIPLTLEIAPAPEGHPSISSTNSVGKFSFFSVLESSIHTAAGGSGQMHNGKSKLSSSKFDLGSWLSNQLEIVVLGNFYCIDPFSVTGDDEDDEDQNSSRQSKGNLFSQELKEYSLEELLQESAKEKLYRRGPTDWFRGMCSNSVTPVVRPEVAPTQLNQIHEGFSALPSTLATTSSRTKGRASEKVVIDADNEDDEDCPDLIPVFVVGGDDES